MLVRIAFEALDPRILPDMGVKVTFLREEDEAAAPAAQPTKLVPKAAVQTDDAGSFVFVIAGAARRRRRTAGCYDWRHGRRSRGSSGRPPRGRSSGRLAAAGARRRRQGGGTVTPLVTVTDVHKHFTRGSERIDVLKGVNLEIPQGDFLALMGPSGSGKTTLLNLIGGLDLPTGGSVEVGGVQISKLERRQPVQMALAERRLRVPAV